MVLFLLFCQQFLLVHLPPTLLRFVEGVLLFGAEDIIILFLIDLRYLFYFIHEGVFHLGGHVLFAVFLWLFLLLLGDLLHQTVESA